MRWRSREALWWDGLAHGIVLAFWGISVGSAKGTQPVVGVFCFR